ncbi:mitoguardin 1-like [Dendronephthya gigantea]|uniref:mitoguardin 1-like n=1 Tax=Dendronephthya gigantea TaxID=151771 RepID=UPI0010692FE0|nr:mitoguardin 1-like [Dendronephthya gigantea]
MNGLIESPLFKMFATTNSLFLGVGALYLVSFGRESVRKMTDNNKVSIRKQIWLDERVKYTESEGLEEFAQHLEEWNRSLAELENLLANNIQQSRGQDDVVEDRDEVDAMDIAGFHNADLIYEKVDTTLNNVVSKIGKLRYMLKSKQHDSNFNPGKSITRDDDSDTDSFLSAEGDEDDFNQEISNTDHTQEKALQAAGIHRDKPFYLNALEQYFKHGIKCCKKTRAKMVGCLSDVEFLAKVYCIREASKMAFAKKDVQLKFEQNGTELLRFLITTAGKDHNECEKRWKALLGFCKKPENFKIFERELSKRGVPFITFYDLVLDFVVMDAFVDLENPPYSIKAAVQNSWLPTYIQQTGLETAVWGVLKAKMQMLDEPAGFLMHFYHLSEILTPVLAWGFLGSDKALKNACSIFKIELMGFIKDLFSFERADYSSLESLSTDISRLAEERDHIKNRHQDICKCQCCDEL